MAGFHLTADVCSGCLDEATNDSHSLELETRLIGNSATYAQVFEKIFKKYDRVFDENEAGGEVIDLTNETQLQRIFRTPRPKTPCEGESGSEEDSSGSEGTKLDCQQIDSPFQHVESSSGDEEKGEDRVEHVKKGKGCVWEDRVPVNECVLEDRIQVKEEREHVWEDRVHIKEEERERVWEDRVHVKEERGCVWEDRVCVKGKRGGKSRIMRKHWHPIQPIQPADPELTARLHKKVVEIKKEMNWDEEERLHWNHVESKLQEQADSSSEEEAIGHQRRQAVAVTRVAPALPSEEDMVSGFVTSETESGYEERTPKREGSQLLRPYRKRRRQLERYHTPAKRRKLQDPVRPLWKPPQYYPPARLTTSPRTPHCHQPHSTHKHISPFADY